MWLWLRRLFGVCRHDWLERARTYAPPVDESLLVWLDRSERDEAVSGVTSIMLECCLCHQHKVITMLGTDKSTKVAKLYAINSRGPHGKQ